jgi:streptogramin lyase
MTRTRKTTLLITSAAVGAATLLGAAAGPAAAQEPAPRYHLTQAWPTHDDATPFTAIALAESGGRSAGKVEFEWKVEEGES